MKVDASNIKKILKKLKHKDPVLFERIKKEINKMSKLDEFSMEKHFKNLRYDLSPFKRIQVGSFILFFKIEGNTIIFTKFTHHDGAYRR